MRPLILALSAAALLVGCATPPGPLSRSAMELDRLYQDCAARGGVLVPSGERPRSGDPALENVCRTHQATRIPQ